MSSTSQRNAEKSHKNRFLFLFPGVFNTDRLVVVVAGGEVVGDILTQRVSCFLNQFVFLAAVK